MSKRPRIDLDGVALHAAAAPGAPLAVFRYRTTGGLLLLIPESAELLVGWENVRAAELDLVSGVVRIRFEPDWACRQGWLRGAKALEGRWTDRFKMEPPGDPA